MIKQSNSRIAFRVSIGVAALAVHGMGQAQGASPGDGDIVVTATRQSQVISKVPLSISAASQESLDTQGVRNIDDVTRFTPGLTLTRNGFGTQASISIRGVSSNIGAGTVGVYIDDTPIQTRSIGYSSTNVYPRLFDLERLEVLRGPQGTLFGAGSEGGTVRFITPAPSLGQISAYGRAEFGVIDGGGVNWEAGAALGGPIIEDKLGFRVSFSQRRDGGFIDRVNQFTGEVLDKNANYQDSTVARGAVTWAPVADLKITPSMLYQDTRLHDVYTYWDKLSDPGRNVYRNGQRLRQPDSDHFIVPALKVEFNGPGFDIFSNTSYFKRAHKATDDYTNLMVGLYANANTLPELPDYESKAYMQNYYKAFTQELRVQSQDPNARLTWVLGVFYNKLTQNAHEQIVDPQMGDLFQATLGHSVLDETGMELIDGQYSLLADFNTVDKQLAFFGEASYEIFGGLRAIAGVRYSRSRYSSRNNVTGPFNYGTAIDQGKGKENPVTPKFGLSWQIDPRNLVYATVAKGFRVGGVNPSIPVSNCGTDLDQRGYTNGAPSSYGADSLWSYELGTKNRLFGGATQIAASVFHIRWKNIQRNIYLGGCALQFTDNLGVAVSNGFDVDITQRLFGGLSLNVQAGYTDSHFAEDIYGRLDRLPQVRKGNALQSQPWTVVVGAEYRRPVGRNEGYARIDYNYRGGRKLTSGQDPRTSSYNPDSFDPDPTNNVNIRLGLEMDRIDLSLFATNLFNDHPALTHYAEGGDPIFRETTVTPRTIGITAALRY